MKKKSKEQYEEMKNKLEKLEYDYEQNMNKLVEERNNLKKQNRLLEKKQEGDDEGGFVNKDVLVQTQNDYEKQIDELRLQLEEERKLKVQMESEKKTNRIQIIRIKRSIRIGRKSKKKIGTLQKSFNNRNGRIKRIS